MKDWQQQVVADAAQHPEAPYAALARWAGVHDDTLRKARKVDPAFDRAINDARRGIVVNPTGIVGIEEFVRSKEYLGLGVRGLDEGGTVYPNVLDHLKALSEGDYSLAIMAGGIGSAKTMTSVVCLVYQCYSLLSQEDPHQYLELDPASPVLIVLQNRSIKLATANAYALFRSLVEASPWFQRNMPHDTRLRSKLAFLKRAVEVWPVGGDAQSVLGMNVFSALLDEANFHDITTKSKRAVTGDRTYDAARESFEGLVRRKLSRLDEDKGIVFVSSSRRYRGEFTGQLEEEFGDDPHTYLFDETCWSINPDAYRDGKWFYVFEGDETRQPRIMGEDEIPDPADRHLVARVPRKFRRQFRNNVVRSLQDLAGRSLSRTGNYFTSREDLVASACAPNVLMASSQVEADASELLPDRNAINWQNPKSPRAVHADLSLSGDDTGICVAHIAGFDAEGRQLILVDGIAKVSPPRFGQIDIDSVYRLVSGWKAIGVQISYFSCDQFQSSDLMQRVQRLGIRTGKISIDMTTPTNPCDAYETLRMAVAEGRIRFPNDPELIEELLQLEHDRKRNRIEHPPNGAKDLCDALAGAVYQLSRIPSWQLVGKVHQASYAAATNQLRLGGEVTAIPAAVSGVSEMEWIRMRRGMPARD